MTVVWLISLRLKNASIVDVFWGLGFVILNSIWFVANPYLTPVRIAVLALVVVWGLRLSIHILLKNLGKPEDFRYQKFRKDFGEKRYWWVSFFQVFMLQGVLLWLVSAPLYIVNFNSDAQQLTSLEVIGIIVWFVGFMFEAIGDYQLSEFKQDRKNKNRLMTRGLWKYTRHPNYFGDAMVWWGFGIISISSGIYWGLLSSVLMTFLLIKISGVAMIERTLIHRPGFTQYAKQTSMFLPWFPQKRKRR